MGKFTVIGGSLVILAGIIFTAFSLSLSILIAGQYLILSVILLSIGGFIVSRGTKDPKFKLNKSIMKGIAIGVGGVIVYVAIMYGVISTNSLYVMSNDGMAPAIKLSDVMFVEKTPFTTIQKGDVIVFHDPDDKNIVSRVQKITSENPRILQTEGDAKPSTTRLVSEDKYIGKVYYVISELGKYIIPAQIAIMITIFMVPVVVMKLRTKNPAPT